MNRIRPWIAIAMIVHSAYTAGVLVRLADAAHTEGDPEGLANEVRL